MVPLGIAVPKLLAKRGRNMEEMKDEEGFTTDSSTGIIDKVETVVGKALGVDANMDINKNGKKDIDELTVMKEFVKELKDERARKIANGMLWKLRLTKFITHAIVGAACLIAGYLGVPLVL